MNSMQDLNGFGQNFRLYNDDRSPQASFTTPTNQVVFLNNNQNSFVLPTGSDIISQRSISNVSVFQVDLGGTTGNVTWPTPLPPGVVSSVTSPNIYKVTGPLVKQYYDEIKAPTIAFPSNYKTKTRFPANLSLGSNSTSWLTDVVWPYAGASNVWSFGNSTSSTSNDSDNFSVTMTIVGSNLDPYLSNATVSLGNVASNTSLSVGSPDSNGNVTLTLTGSITDPRQQAFPPFTYLSNVSTNVTIQSTSGDVLTQTGIPLLINVDGLVNDTYAYGGTCLSSESYCFNGRNVTHVSSGITENFETTITCSYPNYGGVYAYTVWVTSGNTAPANTAAFTSKTIVTGALTGPDQRAVIGSFSSSSQNTYTIRIDQLISNWATLTRPSQDINQGITIAIQKGTGVPAPASDDIVISVSKTNITGVLKTRTWSLNT